MSEYWSIIEEEVEEEVSRVIPGTRRVTAPPPGSTETVVVKQAPPSQPVPPASPQAEVQLLADIKDLLGSIPFALSSDRYQYVMLAPTEPYRIAANGSVTVYENRGGRGWVFAVAIVSYGSPELEISLRTQSLKGVNEFKETIANLMGAGYTGSTTFKVLAYDPANLTYSVESMPNNWYVFFNGYAKMDLKNLSGYPLDVMWKVVVAEEVS
ncbi:MAG: hypothetical protein ACP5RJ_08665 [Conexivisphaera sp.]